MAVVPIVPLSGITTNTLGAITFDAGVVRTAMTIIGATVGGVDFDPGVTYKAEKMDGQRVERLLGYDRVTTWKPVLKCKLIELKTTDLANFLPGSTSVATGGTTVYTPQAGGVLIVAASYIPNFNFVGTKGDGSLWEILFPLGALCTKWSLKTTDAGKAEYDAEFEAMGDPANPANAPYVIKMPLASIAVD